MRARLDRCGDGRVVQEVADAAPRFWVHCRYCVFQLFLMNTPWEFQGFDILWPCWWTCLDTTDSIRETELKRSLNQAMKHNTAVLRWKREPNETIFTEVLDDVRVNAVYTFSWLKTSLQLFATLQLLFCKQHLQLWVPQLRQVTVTVLGSLSFC